MSLNSFLLMRQEILLLAILLLLIVGEIFIPKNKKSSVVHLALFLFGIHTAVGFLGIEESSLFGGMFQTNNLIHFFKNALNIGVLVLLLQSADWIQEKIVQKNKGTEFFILVVLFPFRNVFYDFCWGFLNVLLRIGIGYFTSCGIGSL